MAFTVTLFRNRDNFAKYQLFHYETGTSVIIQVLQWLYQGQSPINCLLLDLTNLTNKDLKEIQIEIAKEPKKIAELVKGNIGLDSLNFTLLYKITQSFCGLKIKSDPVWSHRCTNHDELEYLLFKLMDGLSNRPNISESDIVDKSQVIESLLTLILQKAGQSKNIDTQEIDDMVLTVKDDIKLICCNDQLDAPMKYRLFYNRSGSNVMAKILHWLYRGSSPIGQLVVDLPKMKEINTNGTQKETLKELKDGKISISDLDLTFLYQIVQAVCGLADRNEKVWARNCPSNQQEELEYLLFKLKDGRNNMAHPGPDVKNISDSDVDDKSDEMKLLLTTIIEKAGEKAQHKVNTQEVRDFVTSIEVDIERIRNDYIRKPFVLEKILNDLKNSHKEKLESSILKGYSAPYLDIPLVKNTIHLKYLLTSLKEFQVILIQGEAGEGKTSLTRYLFYKWLTGDADSVVDLASFEVVLRLECRCINSGDVSLFLENTFPIASNSFPNTSSINKHLSDYKVLWIMDGFDESKGEFKGFLHALTNKFPKDHKLIITTRPLGNNEIPEHIRKLEPITLSMGLLRKENIEDIARNFISNLDERNHFLQEVFPTLEKTVDKKLLLTPLNMTLFLNLWLKDKSLECGGTYSSKTLFIKTIKQQLKLLEERLMDCTDFRTRDLTLKVEKWFYGSLCKLCFIMVVNRTYDISPEDVEQLEREANVDLKKPSDCLTTFLDSSIEKERVIYNFKHKIQQYVLASLFLQKWYQYRDTQVIDAMKEVHVSSQFHLDEVNSLFGYYIDMAIEDDTINTDSRNVFNTAKDVIVSFLPKEQCFLLYSIVVRCDFNVNLMRYVSKIFPSIPYLDTTLFESYTQVSTFVRIVRPEIVKLSDNYYWDSQWSEEFLALVGTLIDLNSEICLDIQLNEDERELPSDRKFVLEELNKSSLKVTSLRGSVDTLSLLRNHCSNFKSVSIVVFSMRDLIQLFAFLHTRKTLDAVEIIITFDTHPSFETIEWPVEIIKFGSRNIRSIADFNAYIRPQKGLPGALIPLELIERTSVTFRRVVDHKFEEYIKFVRQMKGDNIFKLKEMRFPVGTDSQYKQRLEEIATKVVGLDEIEIS